MNSQIHQKASRGKFQELTVAEAEPKAGVWGLRSSSIACKAQSASSNAWAVSDRFCADHSLCSVRKIRLDTKSRYFTKLLASLFAALTMSLVACGGGGGGESGSATAPPVGTAPVTPMPPAVPEVSDVSPSCTGCAAVNNTTYSGSGIGIWHKTNLNAGTSNVAVSLAGLVNKKVTLIVTNETRASQVFPPLKTHSDSMQAPVGPAPEADPAAVLAATPKVHRNAIVALSAVATQQRTFWMADGTNRPVTLMHQYALADGATVKLWVENAQLGATRVTPAIAESIGATFAGANGVYDTLHALGGPLWGPHDNQALLPWDHITIDLVVASLDSTTGPYGQVGYFWGKNNMKKEVAPTSNESLAIFLDAETTYMDGERGLQAIKSVMAHEGQHMSNFYHRSVLMGPEFQFDLWLEEMTAMMAEDAFASTLGKTYNPTRDSRMPYYLSDEAFGCTLSEFACSGYALSGSFGGFLTRQLGLPFLKALLAQSVGGSESALEFAIKAVRPTSSIGEELRKFTVATVGLLPAATAPAGFGYPARSDAGLTLVGIDAQALSRSQRLPSAAPEMLGAYASFPVSRIGVSGIFRETVRVPAGATLSVVVGD